MEANLTLLKPLISIGLELLFYCSLLFFTIYTVFLTYHWFAFGTNKATATLALAVFLLGSMPLFLTMALTF